MYDKSIGTTFEFTAFLLYENNRYANIMTTAYTLIVAGPICKELNTNTETI